MKNSNVVIDVVASQLRSAQAAGDAPGGLNPDVEAISLLALASGLATSILGGQSTAEQAQAVIDYHLDRLFPPPRRGQSSSQRGPADPGSERALVPAHASAPGDLAETRKFPQASTCKSAPSGVPHRTSMAPLAVLQIGRLTIGGSFLAGGRVL